MHTSKRSKTEIPANSTIREGSRDRHCDRATRAVCLGTDCEGRETVVLVGLAPGPHKVLLELADATHKPIPGASKLVEFIVPAPKGPHN